MSVWTGALVGLLILIAGASVAVCRGTMMDRIVALQLAGVLATLSAVTLALATGRTLVLDVALVLAVLTLVGGLAYARFLERWL